MGSFANALSVFVKPWKSLTLQELAGHVRKLGFDAIELPVRPGFPCRPETVEQDLAQAVTILGDQGVKILNVTADLPLDDERLYAACARSAIPMNRVMFRLDQRTYWEAELAARRQLDAALPLCERYNVQIGIQNHVGRFVAVHEMGLHHLVHDYDPRFVGIVWDAAHNALAGMDPEPALDVVASHLCMVNLKNAYWQRINGPEAATAQWSVYWTSGRHGLASWQRVIGKLNAMAYAGPICLTAEYSDHDGVDSLIVEDLAFARSLLAST